MPVKPRKPAQKPSSKSTPKPLPNAPAEPSSNAPVKQAKPSVPAKRSAAAKPVTSAGKPSVKSAAKASVKSAVKPPKSTVKSTTKSASRPATRATSRPAKSTASKKAKPAVSAPKPPRKTPEEIAIDWAARLGADRPGLVEWVLDRLSEYYGKPIWHQSHDPTSQLVLTMLSANSADTNAEVAFEALRDAYCPDPLPDGADRTPRPRDGWGGKGIADLPPPDWHRVETAPLDELIDVIRPGGLGPQKAPRIQAALSAIHDQAGGHSLGFLERMEALRAREWMTQIPGIGPKTASVVLLFSFGMPLMPVDRHVERVSVRVGMLPPKVTADQAHEDFLELVPPDRMYEGHIDLIRHGRSICHAQRPECGRCPIAERCRYVNRDAP